MLKNVEKSLRFNFKKIDKVVLNMLYYLYYNRKVYLAKSAPVAAALHVNGDITWAVCADLNYDSTVQDVSSYLHHALKTIPSSRILLYAGDVDMACNFLGGARVFKMGNSCIQNGIDEFF